MSVNGRSSDALSNVSSGPMCTSGKHPGFKKMCAIKTLSKLFLLLYRMSWFQTIGCFIGQIWLAVIILQLLLIIVGYMLGMSIAGTATKSPFLPFSPLTDSRGKVVPHLGPYCKDDSDCESGYCYQNWACMDIKLPSGERCEKPSACKSNVCLPAVERGEPPRCA